MGTRRSLYTRDLVDEAVRRLATSPAGLTDRLIDAGEVLTRGLDKTDFPEREDAELFERIVMTVGAIRGQEAQGTQPSGCFMSDATIQAAAEDILDLRDTVMGRAILEARREQPDSGERVAYGPAMSGDGGGGTKT